MDKGWKRVVAGAAALVAAAAVGACDAATQVAPPLAATEAAFVINTDKTMFDHFASAANQQDCSTIRAQKGGHYCVDPYENAPTVPALYCYRTLADVTCYDRPSTHPGDRLVGVRPAGRLPTY